MKTYSLTKYFVLCGLFCCFILSGCSSSDKYVGQWETDSHNGHNTLRIYEDGSYRWLRENALVPLITGNWKVSGDKLIMTEDNTPDSDKYPTEYNVVRINERQLFIRWNPSRQIDFMYEFEKTKD